MEQVRGLTLRLQLYTVPGQVFYDATRKLVLNGADGVVFVADSQPAALDSNLESMGNLETNLSEMGIDLTSFPFVIQYNKRDLPGALPVAELRRQLNGLGVPEIETIASRGEGVLEALREITRLVVRDLNARQPRRAPPTRFSGGGSELARGLSEDAPAHTPAPISGAPDRGQWPGPGVPFQAVRRGEAIAAAAPPRDRGQLVGLSFARLFPGEGTAVAEVELEDPGARLRAGGPARRRGGGRDPRGAAGDRGGADRPGGAARHRRARAPPPREARREAGRRRDRAGRALRAVPARRGDGEGRAD